MRYGVKLNLITLSFAGMSPSSRWIVNFDNDFLDGLVLASVLVAYAPFVVSHHLPKVYLNSRSTFDDIN